eukprot:RCo022490
MLPQFTALRELLQSVFPAADLKQLCEKFGVSSQGNTTALAATVAEALLREEQEIAAASASASVHPSIRRGNSRRTSGAQSSRATGGSRGPGKKPRDVGQSPGANLKRPRGAIGKAPPVVSIRR